MRKENKVALIVESPFQMLCAYEASKSESECFDVYVRLNGQASNDSQLRRMAERLFRKVEYLDAPLDSSAKILVSLFRLAYLSYSRSYSRVYVGSFHSGFMRKFLFLFRQRSLDVLFLDDGMATLLLGLRDKSFVSRKGYALFTIFSGFEDSVRVRTHSFERLRHLVSEKACEAKNLFIGQPLVERGYVPIEEYIKCVRLAASRCSGQEFIYIAHRGESENALSLVSQIEGSVVIVPDVCVEWYLIVNGIKPRNLFGFSSTALMSLAMIYEDVGVCFFDIPYRNYPHPEHHRNIISYLENLKGFSRFEFSDSPLSGVF